MLQEGYASWFWHFLVIFTYILTFHVNHLADEADDSHEMSSIIFLEN